MPIVDNVLVAQVTEEKYNYPTIPFGDRIEQLVRENIKKHGDITWMVKVFLTF